MEYHYLVAGLPDIQWDSTQKVPSLEQLQEELTQALSQNDLLLFNMLRNRYDNQNLLAFLQDREAKLSPLGAIDPQSWHELIEKMENEPSLKDQRLPAYIIDFYQQIAHSDGAAVTPLSHEACLTARYFAYGSASRNDFVAQWFTYLMNLNNILTAAICRKHGFDIKTAIIGDNEVAETLRTSTARDFDLGGQLDDVASILTIANEPDLYRREKMLDALKWNWIEEHCIFFPFGIEKVLAFWLQCEILNRWNLLDRETGTAIFKNILSELKKDITI